MPSTEIAIPLDADEARRELNLPGDRRIALFVGLIRPYKGVDVLIEAFSKLAAIDEWHLVVAGEPWGRSGGALRQLVRTLGVEDRVRLDLRWVSEDELRLLMAAADVVVLPYRSGSQSAMAPIAFASGVPVVASAVGGLPEVVDDGVNGLLVEPGSVNDLVRALGELDEDRLALLATGARAWRGTITWDSYAARLEALLERVTNE
jgi:glycosyltransferase involved in cell wall biosynthesis